MPRAGTTAVMKAVYGSGKFASLKYNDMPFAVCPNLWASITKFHQKQTISKERSHLDGVTIDYSSPESFEGFLVTDSATAKGPKFIRPECHF